MCQFENEAMQALMLDILHEEVKPATGCTEPVAVAYAVAAAKDWLNRSGKGYAQDDLLSLEVGVSPNLFKNGLGVGIPNCKERGLQVAAALGLVACEAKEGLKVFETMEEDKVHLASDLAKRGQVQISVLDTDEKIKVVVNLKMRYERLELILSGRHDRIDHVIYNDVVVYAGNSLAQSSAVDKSAFFNTPLTEVIHLIADMNPEPMAFLLEGLKMNREVAEAGLNEPLGMGVGYGLKSCMDEGALGSDLATKAMTLTAAASDARMSGLNMTVMSSNGSGNNGLTAILPLAAYFEANEVTRTEQIRALAMSHLLNCYVKERIGRLSAMCSCAISAATGSGAAIAWLMSGKVETVLGTIQNMTGNLSGMICDGAKEGCALKLATGAATGVQAAILAQHGIVMPVANGIVGRTAEESIEHLGELSQRGMQLTDHVILDMMRRMV